MSYATMEDLEERLDPQTLVALADDDGDGLADAAALEAALEDADSQIDLFLAARYATPIASPPKVLRRMAADIAIHALFARKRSAVSPEHAARYGHAIKALSEVAAGKLSLPAVPARAQAASTSADEERAFSAEALEEF